MNKNSFLFGSVVLIILAIGMVAILDQSSSKNSGTSDTRARAAQVKTLMVNATVASVDSVSNTITVQNLYMADESRSGNPVNLGAWIVTPPASFDVNTLSEGAKVKIGVDSKTFLASKKTLTAVTIVPLK